jgi:hypothetical protein
LRSARAYCAGEHFIGDLHGATRLDDIDHIEATPRCCSCSFTIQT